MLPPRSVISLLCSIASLSVASTLHTHNVANVTFTHTVQGCQLRTHGCCCCCCLCHIASSCLSCHTHCYATRPTLTHRLHHPPPTVPPHPAADSGRNTTPRRHTHDSVSPLQNILRPHFTTNNTPSPTAMPSPSHVQHTAWLSPQPCTRLATTNTTLSASQHFPVLAASL